MPEIPGEVPLYPKPHEILLGKPICPIILGTSRFATSEDRDPETGYFKPRDDRRESEIQFIIDAINNGVNVIDTAAAYGDSENIIGDALAHLDRRSVIVITKVGIQPVTPDEIQRSIERSNRRLGSPPDIIMMHTRWDTDNMDACIAQLDKAQDLGLAKSIGISNFQPAELVHAMAITKHPIVAYEAKLNLVNPRKDFIDLKRICDEHHIPFLASSVLDRGAVFRLQEDPLLKEFSAKYQMSVAQLAIYAILNSGALPIVQSHSLDHIREDLSTLKFGMVQKDINRLTGMLLDKVTA